MKKIFINTQLETKALDKDRVIEYIATKEVVDRMGDLIKVKGINTKNFKKNAAIFWAHNHSDPPIGKAISLTKSGDTMKVKIQFADPELYGFADTIYKLSKAGYINGTSLGILPDYNTIEYQETKKGRTRIINNSELVEISVVPIPMNQEALATNKMLTKAIDEGVIDEVELKEFESMCKDINDPTEEEDKTIDEIIELKAKIKELEFQLEEKKMLDKTEDNVYEELYKEYGNVNKSNIEELYKEYKDINEDKSLDILDEYL